MDDNYLYSHVIFSQNLCPFLLVKVSQLTFQRATIFSAFSSPKQHVVFTTTTGDPFFQLHLLKVGSKMWWSCSICTLIITEANSSLRGPYFSSDTKMSGCGLKNAELNPHHYPIMCSLLVCCLILRSLFGDHHRNEKRN